jgi:hypothetical protein
VKQTQRFAPPFSAIFGGSSLREKNFGPMDSPARQARTQDTCRPPLWPRSQVGECKLRRVCYPMVATRRRAAATGESPCSASRVPCGSRKAHRGNLAPCLLDIHLPLLVPHATRSGMASANMQKSWYAQTLLGVWIGFNVEPPEQKPRGLLWRFCLCHGRLYIEASPGRAWRVFAIHTCLPLKTDGLHSTARQASWKSLVGENRTGDETPSPVSRRLDGTARRTRHTSRVVSRPPRASAWSNLSV